MQLHRLFYVTNMDSNNMDSTKYQQTNKSPSTGLGLDFKA